MCVVYARVRSCVGVTSSRLTGLSWTLSQLGDVRHLMMSLHLSNHL